MLNLQGRGEEGGNRVTFRYINPTPFHQRDKSLKLVDLLARPESESGHLGFKAVLSSNTGVQANFSLKKLTHASVKVEDVGRRLKAHSDKLKQKLSLLKETPRVLYEETDNSFRVHLPPRTGVFAKKKAMFAMLGYHPDSLEQFFSNTPDWWGFFNKDETNHVIQESNEPSFPLLEFRNQAETLDSVRALSEEDLDDGEEEEDYDFIVVFMPSGEPKYIRRDVNVLLESNEDVAEHLGVMFSELESSFNLIPGLFQVEPHDGNAVIMYSFSHKKFDLTLSLTFDSPTTRLLNIQEGNNYHFSLTGLQTKAIGRWSEYVFGPFVKMGKNALHRLLPLLLRLDNGPYESYISGIGSANVVAFLDEDGGIYATPFSMEEYDGSIELIFHRRDLTSLNFHENLIFFAHFAIL